MKRSTADGDASPKRARSASSDSLGERLADPLLDPPPTRVAEGLFCGADWNLANAARLQALGIGAVLSVADDPPDAALHGISVLHIAVEDDANADIRAHFDRATVFIASELAKGHAVMVASPRGLSRAPTMCVAYLVKMRPMLLRDAYMSVRAARATVRPNVGFFTQLMNFEMEVRRIAQPSMSLQEYRRGLFSLWGAQQQNALPLSAHTAPGDSSDDDSASSSASDIDALNDPADVPVAESDLEDDNDDEEEERASEAFGDIDHVASR